MESSQVRLICRESWHERCWLTLLISKFNHVLTKIDSGEEQEFAPLCWSELLTNFTPFIIPKIVSIPEKLEFEPI